MIFLQANGNFDSRLNFTQILDLLKSGGKMTFITADKNKIRLEYNNLSQDFEFSKNAYEAIDLRHTAIIHTDATECDENMFISDYYEKINSVLNYLYKQLKVDEGHYETEQKKAEKLKTFKLKFVLDEYYPKYTENTYLLEIKDKFEYILDYNFNEIIIINLISEKLKKTLQLDENYFKETILKERHYKNLDEWLDRIRYIKRQIQRYEIDLNYIKNNYLEYCL